MRADAGFGTGVRGDLGLVAVLEVAAGDAVEERGGCQQDGGRGALLGSLPVVLVEDPLDVDAGVKQRAAELVDGLEPSALLALRGRVSTFWHFAASLAYEERAADEIHRHHTGGANAAHLDAVRTPRGRGRPAHAGGSSGTRAACARAGR